MLIAALQFNVAMAVENITGTWQGKLISTPGAEITIQFIITQGDDGAYMVLLNSPDKGAIKNIKANSVEYNAGNLKLDVAELSGSYEGVFKEGKIEGEWMQEGIAIPLILSPYEKPTLSKEDKERLLGEWHGQLVIPTGPLTAVFRFEMTEEDEFVGFYDSPDLGALGMQMTDMGMSDDNLTFKLPSQQAKYKGKLTGNEMVGEFKQGPQTFPATLKKGEYKATVNNLSLPDDTKELLLGKWSGKLGPLTVLFRFEKAETGEFIGFLDSPNQGAMGIPITEATLSGGKLTLKVNSINAEYNGQLSGNELVGEWTQVGNSAPLSLTKE